MVLIWWSLLVAVVLPQDSVVWNGCPGDSVEPLAQCAVVPLPLSYDWPDGPTISIAVKRILSGPDARAQLWFLDGGPGDAGTASLGRLSDVLGQIDGLDLYTLDHRGVGGSALLECPEQQAAESDEGREITSGEWPACIAFVETTRDDLPALTAEASAHDLGRLISALRQPDKRVFVMGASYGTYLANRYLRLYPTQPDGVILDGIVPADWTFTEFDAGLNATAIRVLTLCGEDPECAAHLGDDPVQATSDLFVRLDTGGRCLGIGPDLMRLLLGNLLMIEAIPYAYVTALIYRFDRCNWRDQLAILHLFRVLNSDEIASEAPSHSPVLQRHVALSEIWDPTVRAEALTDALQNYLMTTEVSASFGATFDRWPRYEAIDADVVAGYDGPLLMLHGGLDPTMSVERLADTREHFSGPGQSFVFFPHGQHVALTERKLVPADEPSASERCTLSLYASFIRNPEAPVDTSCVSDAVPPAFDGDAATTRLLLGTDDPWGDEIPAADWILYMGLYRVPAPAIAVAVIVLALMRTRSVAKTGVVRAGRAVGALVLWILISAVAWQAGILAPLLLEWTAPATIVLIIVLIALQLGAGMRLVTWTLNRGTASLPTTAPLGTLE